MGLSYWEPAGDLLRRAEDMVPGTSSAAEKIGRAGPEENGPGEAVPKETGPKEAGPEKAVPKESGSGEAGPEEATA